MIIYSNQQGIIESRGIKYNDGQETNVKLPETVIAFYSKNLFDRFLNLVYVRPVGYIATANLHRDIYVVKYKDMEFGLFMAGVTGPVIASDIEEVSASGAKRFIIFGNCGVLDKRIEDLKIIIPNLAYRDEGTSQHYIEDSETISVNEKYQEDFIQILNELGIEYERGATWTTDAIYRETPEKKDYFKNLGCLTVEMEASTISAVCKFKGLEYFTFFYAGDNLDGIKWEERSIQGLTRIDEKEKIPFLALELAYRISKNK